MKIEEVRIIKYLTIAIISIGIGCMLIGISNFHQQKQIDKLEKIINVD